MNLLPLEGMVGVAWLGFSQSSSTNAGSGDATESWIRAVANKPARRVRTEGIFALVNLESSV